MCHKIFLGVGGKVLVLHSHVCDASFIVGHFHDSIDFVHEKRHMDVGEGGGVGACDVSRWKIEIFNILRSSKQSIQNPAFS